MLPEVATSNSGKSITEEAPPVKFKTAADLTETLPALVEPILMTSAPVPPVPIFIVSTPVPVPIFMARVKAPPAPRFKVVAAVGRRGRGGGSGGVANKQRVSGGQRSHRGSVPRPVIGVGGSRQPAAVGETGITEQVVTPVETACGHTRGRTDADQVVGIGAVVKPDGDPLDLKR